MPKPSAGRSNSPRLLAMAGFTLLLGASAPARADAITASSSELRSSAAAAPLLFVDRDDDDANGVPDGEQGSVPFASELFAVPRGRGGIRPLRASGVAKVPDFVRALIDGKLAPAASSIPVTARRVDLQAVRAGRGEAEILGRTVAVRAIELRALDGLGNEIDLARSHASLQRTPPDRLGEDPFGNSADPDALRFVLVGLADDLPGTINLLSLSPVGTPLDTLMSTPLGHVPCPPGVPAGMTCGSTRPIRAVADDIDKNHPMVADRSLKAVLGGAIAVASATGEKLQMIRVGGPRQSALGSIVRYRAKLRVILVRPTPHGPPPMGTDDAGALQIARTEVERANALWGACGISFGPVNELDATIVDPPRPHMIALGCDHGLPASGGVIRARVDGHEFTVKLTAGMRPAAAARAMAAAVGAAGFSVRVSDNAPINAGAFGSSDVLVRRRDGSLALVEPPVAGSLSSDPTMTACLGRVDLEDGLQHFGDIDAIAGTVEERALIKAFDDGDPSTIEVLMVPSFAGGGRIGESFISADGGAVRNAIIEDRAGVRADRASFALAHELGHVLLDDPGHPDDFGVDTPTRLMDADAANASAYGPRRLLVDECVRALRQSGPDAAVPLLKPWPLAPLGRDK
jgi:hypothetical protein